MVVAVEAWFSWPIELLNPLPEQPKMCIVPRDWIGSFAIGPKVLQARCEHIGLLIVRSRRQLIALQHH